MTDTRTLRFAPSPACRGGLGRGQLLIFPASPGNPLPTSPCQQGEEQSGTYA